MSKRDIAQAMAGLGGNAGLAAALQGKLDSMVGRSSGYLEALPGKARRRAPAAASGAEQGCHHCGLTQRCPFFKTPTKTARR